MIVRKVCLTLAATALGVGMTTTVASPAEAKDSGWGIKDSGWGVSDSSSSVAGGK